MEYRYYLYRERLLKSEGDKYSITLNYDYLTELHPVGQWTIKHVHDDDWTHIWRREFNGSLIFSGADYDALIAATADPSDCRQLAIRIQRKCEGTWADFWDGFFSKYDFKVDADRCTISFKPQVVDEYNALFNSMDDKINFYDAGSAVDANLTVYGYPVEYYITPPIFTMAYPNSYLPPTYIELNYTPAANQEYFMYETRVKYEPRYDTAGRLLSQYRLNWIWAREYTFNNSATVPPTGSYWIMVEETTPGTVWKWARRIGAQLWTTYDELDNGDIQYWTLHGYSTAMGSSHMFQNLRYLSDVISYCMARIGYDWHSYLFNYPTGTVNPMGGHSLKYISIGSTSELGHFSDPARKQEITLKEILMGLKELFNISIMVQNRTLVIEHEMFYYYAYSYTLPKSVALDLTAGQYEPFARSMNKFEYLAPPKFRYEEWQIPFSDGPDFVGEPISYPCDSDSASKSHATKFATDLWWMYVHSEELPRDGLILVDVYWTPGGISMRAVRNVTGFISGALIPNGQLAIANLHDRYWKWERLFPRGKMNGTDTDFYSYAMQRKQTPLTVPGCCESDYMSNGYIRTGLGDGTLEEAEYDAKSGMTKLTIKHG